METKLSQLQACIAACDQRGALRIAAKFYNGMPMAEMAIVRRAHECYSNATFYAQLGFDPEQQKEEGYRLLVDRYSPAALAARKSALV